MTLSVWPDSDEWSILGSVHGMVSTMLDDYAAAHV